MQCDSPWSAELLRWKQRLQLRWQSFGFGALADGPLGYARSNEGSLTSNFNTNTT